MRHRSPRIHELTSNVGPGDVAGLALVGGLLAVLSKSDDGQSGPTDDHSGASGAGDTRDGPESPPDINDFSDPNNLPAGWDWRGNGLPGSREGAYHNPETGESLHDDRTHPAGKDPHVTYTDSNGTRWDNFGDEWQKQDR